MELKRRHLLVLLLLAGRHNDIVDKHYEDEAIELCSHGYVESNGDLTDKGDMAVAYAVKKAGEI